MSHGGRCVRRTLRSIHGRLLHNLLRSLSALSQKLGFRPGGTVREHVPFISSQRDIQSLPGPGNLFLAHADAVEPTNEQVEEAGAHASVWCGSDVRLPNFHEPYRTAKLCSIGSVCISTIIRIVAVVKFNRPGGKEDFTYRVIDNALWSFVEPSLGIINACLPIIPPVFQETPLSNLLTSIRGPMKHWKGSLETFKPGGPRPESQKLHPSQDDVYPLTSIRSTAGKHQSLCHSNEVHQGYVIHVRHDFETRSSGS